MRRSWLIIVPGLLLLVAAVIGLAPAAGAEQPGKPPGRAVWQGTPTSTPPATPTETTTPLPCSLSWNVIASPSVGPQSDWLNGVSAIAANDAWAVGYYETGTGGGKQILIEHWTGAQWELVPSPNSGDESVLQAVTARAPGDVWAVGWFRGPYAITHTLVEHWDGRQWRIVPSPDGDSGANYLNGVVARAADDVWAVGYSERFGTVAGHTLALHWNGSRWDVVPTVDIGSTNTELEAVTAVASNAVWATGSYFDEGIGALQTLVERWDGNQWSVVPSPNVGTVSDLHGIFALGAADVWAAGTSEDSTGLYQTLTEHWDGSQWSVVPSPNVGALSNLLYAVAGSPTGEVWAVGSYYTESKQPTLILHWNGKGWSVAANPSPGTVVNELRGVSAVSASEVWAVGESFSGGQQGPALVEHYGDSCASPAPTSTPLATPTACVVSFSDVPADSPFYTYIRCLACQGIVSGYGDGTFRPGANVTRGQLTKMVVLAAGWPIDTTGGPHFSDVPQNHPFYAFVETAYHHQVISGYADGTFRPGAAVTRGQLAKIVSTAAGLGGQPGFQLFEDVPPTDPFYSYAQMLGAHLIINGYGCGGPGEPCVAPYDRTYFRLANNATRGQIAKIVYLALAATPSCGSAGAQP